MDYFVNHIGVIIGGACFVAIAAVVWWFLTEKNAELKRQRARARAAAKVDNTDND